MFKSELLCSVLLFACVTAPLAADDSFFQKNDRIIFLGNTLIEREQKTSFWETQLQMSFPKLDLTFRNLGWDGDTVWADSRGIFDPPAAGYQRMIELVKEIKPTVIVLAYGGVEAFPDETRRAQFEAQYRKLISDLSIPNVRFVHLSPTVMEYASFPVQSEAAQQHVAAYHQNVDAISQTIEEIAVSTNGKFVNLSECQQAHAELKWTQNGLHLTPEAYAVTGKYIVETFGGSPVELEANETAQQIRELTINKNSLFFHRWRPQNITYLLGFRKHEQGNNAVEIAEFDPLVVELEQKIQRLLKAE